MNISEIINQLSQPIPEQWLKTKSLKGNQITYIPWHHANRLLDQYTPGWQWEVRSITTTSEQIFIIGRLTIIADDGQFCREATGTESLNTSNYGDPSSNAESMAFRRCAAKFGLGLYLYDKEGDRPKSVPATPPPTTKSSAEACQEWVDYGKSKGLDVRGIAQENNLPIHPGEYSEKQAYQLAQLIKQTVQLKEGAKARAAIN